MLKKSTSGVLASLRSSTYRSVRLSSSLVAALLDGLFEHPAMRSCASIIPAITVGFEDKLMFSQLARKELPKRHRLLLMRFELGDRQVEL